MSVLNEIDRSDGLIECTPQAIAELVIEIKQLRAVITRAKDALLDGQSTQWVHDLLVAELARRIVERPT